MKRLASLVAQALFVFFCIWGYTSVHDVMVYQAGLRAERQAAEANYPFIDDEVRQLIAQAGDNDISHGANIQADGIGICITAGVLNICPSAVLSGQTSFTGSTPAIAFGSTATPPQITVNAS